MQFLWLMGLLSLGGATHTACALSHAALRIFQGFSGSQGCGGGKHASADASTPQPLQCNGGGVWVVGGGLQGR